MRKNKNKAEEQKKGKGFTLIEVLVVIGIVGMISVLLVANLGSARAKARDAQRTNDMVKLADALTMYAMDNDYSFPVSQDWQEVDQLSTKLQDRYLKTTPQDPLNQDPYRYFYKTDPEGINFGLCVPMESSEKAYIITPKGRGKVDLEEGQNCLAINDYEALLSGVQAMSNEE